MAKRKANILRNMLSAMMILPTLFKFIRKVLLLFTRELRIASDSVFKIIVLGVIAFVVLMSTWLTLLTLIFAWLSTSLHFSMIAALSILFALNILFLIILLGIILHYKKQISFLDTRHIIRELTLSDSD